jgi:uncharacterized paraquat-inducible protein A
MPFPSRDPESRPTASSDVQQRGRETDQLKAEIERLLLITEALWNLLRQKAALPEDELAREIHRLDLEDGQADYRKRPTALRHCPKCSRVLTKKRAACTFCGAPVPIEPFER